MDLNQISAPNYLHNVTGPSDENYHIDDRNNHAQFRFLWTNIGRCSKFELIMFSTYFAPSFRLFLWVLQGKITDISTMHSIIHEQCQRYIKTGIGRQVSTDYIRTCSIYSVNSNYKRHHHVALWNSKVSLKSTAISRITLHSQLVILKYIKRTMCM